MKINILFIISRSFLLRMKTISDKRCREILNTYFMFNKVFFGSCAVYEIRWKNIVERGRPLMKTWGVRIAFWISKATNTNTSCVILISVPLQQRLNVTLRYTNFACHVNIQFGT